MIEIHLYGKLRQFGPHLDRGRECVIQAVPEGAPAVGPFLASLGIPLDEVGNLFLNGTYDRMGLERPVVGVTRIGVFPRDMSLLYI